MTQALNLANFANKLNTSGQTDNTGLQNSSVTVTAGTGMSGGGAVALGSSTTLTNAGVTSVAAGTGISVSASTGGITITNTAPATGGVTSLNGQTGAITNTTFNTIGSYTAGGPSGAGASYGYGSTIAGSNLYYYTSSYTPWGGFSINYGTSIGASGTWRAMGRSVNGSVCCGTYVINMNLWVRIS